LENASYIHNDLIHSSSPYLKQHAYNPVDWKEWNKEILLEAQKTGKLLIVSIGYSACHWCHVMAHECFEDNEVAEIMNSYFINIKVDREELPHVDQIYMDAINLMTNQGGWPLNAICLPDQSPLYVVTYLNKQDWIKLLLYHVELWKNNKELAKEYATKINKSIVDYNHHFHHEKEVIEISLNSIIEKALNQHDAIHGGLKRQIKFPMPNNLIFFLSLYQLINHELAKNTAVIQLNAMIKGGIYDLIDGGFSRYSTDPYWLVPHFEKMLYDNAQLISLYAFAYSLTNSYQYKKVLNKTISFCENELKGNNGIFYSALDADSEGEEGKYYVFNFNEIKQQLGKDFDFFIQNVDISEHGNWENESIILQRLDKDDHWIYNEHEEEVNLERCFNELAKHRKSKIKPNKDTKSILSWNALMLNAYSQTALYLNEENYKFKAIELEQDIQTHFCINNKWKRIHHDQKVHVDAYLEDYSLYVQALINLYQTTLNEHYLVKANNLTNIVIENFWNTEMELFQFSSKYSEKLISDKYETIDDVINSSNSVMFTNLLFLSHYFLNDEWEKMANNSIKKIHKQLVENPSFYSHWATLYLHLNNGVQTIVGSNASIDKVKFTSIKKENVLLGLSSTDTEIPLFKGKYNEMEMYYVCKGKMCLAPEVDLKDLKLNI